MAFGIAWVFLSGWEVLAIDDFMDACVKCIGSAVMFSVSTSLEGDLLSTWTSGTAFGVSWSCDRFSIRVSWVIWVHELVSFLKYNFHALNG